MHVETKTRTELGALRTGCNCAGGLKRRHGGRAMSRHALTCIFDAPSDYTSHGVSKQNRGYSLGLRSIGMVEDLCGNTPVAKEHDGIPDGVLRLVRQHPMPQPTVYLLPLIFRGHAETLVSFLPAEITSCEFAQRQTPLMILVCPAVVVRTVRLKILVELHATEYEAERPTFIPKQFPQYGTLLSIVL